MSPEHRDASQMSGGLVCDIQGGKIEEGGSLWSTVLPTKQPANQCFPIVLVIDFEFFQLLKTRQAFESLIGNLVFGEVEFLQTDHLRDVRHDYVVRLAVEQTET